jgi:hypothetical protein
MPPTSVTAANKPFNENQEFWELDESDSGIYNPHLS